MAKILNAKKNKKKCLVTSVEETLHIASKPSRYFRAKLSFNIFNILCAHDALGCYPKWPHEGSIA